MEHTRSQRYVHAEDLRLQYSGAMATSRILRSTPLSFSLDLDHDHMRMARPDDMASRSSTHPSLRRSLTLTPRLLSIGALGPFVVAIDT